MSLEYFILKSNNIHSFKYDYIHTVYINNKTKVHIICPVHGDFWQRPDSHTRGSGCSKCSGFNKSNDDAISILIESRKLKGIMLYDYSCSNYDGYSGDVEINCLKHGKFHQKYRTHYNGGNCDGCNCEKNDWDKFIDNLKIKHNCKYDYSLIDRNTKRSDSVNIICPVHGEFTQILKYHTSGRGCQLCAGYTLVGDKWVSKSNTDEFIKKSRNIHGDRYNYDNINYIDSITTVNIICPKHGPFDQKPSHHLMGSGCSKCNVSKGEMCIIKLLDSKSIEYIYQYRIDKYPYDFFLPYYNIMIEFDGYQHFHPVEKFGGQIGFNRQLEIDKLKTEMCKLMGIELIRIPYYDLSNIESILKEKIPNY